MPTIEELDQTLRQARRAGNPELTVKVLCAYGKHHLDQNEIEPALTRLVEAAGISQKADLRFMLGHTMRFLGRAYAAQREDRRAVDCFELAERIGAEYGTPLLSLDGALGRAHLASRDGRVEDAVSAYRAAVEAANQLNDPDRMLALLRELGDYALKMRMLEASVQAYQQMIEAAQIVDNPVALIEGLSGAGHAHLELHREENAVSDFRRALEPAKELKNPTLLEGVLSGLQEALERLGQEEEVADIMAYRIEMVQESRDPALEYQARLALAHFLDKQKDFEQALTQYESAARLAGQLGDKEGELACLRAMADAYERSGFDYMVINAYQAVIDRASELGLRDAEIDARLDMTAALRNLGDLAKALRTVENARELSKIGVDRKREARCLLVMAAIYAEQDNAETASGMLDAVERALEHEQAPELQRELEALRRQIAPQSPGSSGLLGPRLRQD